MNNLYLRTLLKGFTISSLISIIGISLGVLTGYPTLCYFLTGVAIGVYIYIAEELQP